MNEKKIMFVCHGNICRSPMAEFIMKHLVERRGREDEFIIDSTATSREEIGNGIFPAAKYTLSQHNIECRGHRARQFTIDDYNNYDYIVVMEEYNIRNLLRIIGCDCEHKVWKLLDFIDDCPTRGAGEDISDPWYHGNFDKTYKEIQAGCKALLKFIDR